MHDVQDVKQLPLVLMKPLNLNIENGAGIHLYSVVIQDIFRKPYLILVLDIHKLLLGLLIIGINPELSDSGKVGDPLRTHMSRNPVGK